MSLQLTPWSSRHGYGKRRSLWPKSALLFSVLLLTFISPPRSISQEDPKNLDVTLFRRINDGRSSFLDKLTNANNEAVYPVITVAPIGFLSYGLLTGNEYETDSGVLAALSEIVSYGATYSLKKIAKRERPYVTLANVHVVGSRSEDSYSLPSGHSTSAFAIATSLSFRYPKASIVIPLHLWAALLSYGRVYRGVHYPSDVLLGGAIGSGTALVVHLLQDQILGLKNRLLGKSESEADLKGVRIHLVPLRGGGLIGLSYHF